MAGEFKEFLTVARELSATMKSLIQVMGEFQEAMGDFAEATDDATKKTQQSGRGAGGGRGGLGVGKLAVGRVAGDLLGTAAREFGQELLTTGDPVGAATRAGRAALGDPGLEAQRNVEQRVAAQTTLIAQFGGEVPDELRQRLTTQYAREEVAIANEVAQVRREVNRQGDQFIGAGSIPLQDILRYGRALGIPIPGPTR